jgi:hypothetical protein
MDVEVNRQDDSKGRPRASRRTFIVVGATAAATVANVLVFWKSRQGGLPRSTTLTYRGPFTFGQELPIPGDLGPVKVKRVLVYRMASDGKVAVKFDLPKDFPARAKVLLRFEGVDRNGQILFREEQVCRTDDPPKPFHLAGVIREPYSWFEPFFHFDGSLIDELDQLTIHLERI